MVLQHLCLVTLMNLKCTFSKTLLVSVYNDNWNGLLTHEEVVTLLQCNDQFCVAIT